MLSRETGGGISLSDPRSDKANTDLSAGERVSYLEDVCLCCELSRETRRSMRTWACNKVLFDYQKRRAEKEDSFLLRKQRDHEDFRAQSSACAAD